MYGIMYCVVVYAYPAETGNFTCLVFEHLLGIYRENTTPQKS